MSLELDPASADAARRFLNERARTDFYVFQRIMQPHVSAHPYVDAEHLKAISWKLQLMADGVLDRLGIAIPPRHFKSYLTSVAFPAFMLGRDPAHEIICASYGFDLSLPLARMARTLMQSQRYQEIFPATRLSSKNPAAEHLLTTAGGYRHATSTAGPITGIGAELLIYDDPLKANDAGSQAARDAAWEWLENAPSRITKTNGRIIVPMQRLHADDPIGRLKERGVWDILELPAQFALTTTVATGKSKEKIYQPGELLFPERFTKTSLQRRRDEIGERAFQAQYLQAPQPSGGRLFRVELFQRFDLATNNKRSQYEAIILSLDPGVSSAPNADPTAMTLWGVRGLDLYLLDASRGNWAFAEQLAKLRPWRPKVDAMLIERSHSGIMLVEALLAEQDKPAKFIGFTPKLDKYVRAEAAAFALEKGRIFLPEKAVWLEGFEKEVSVFPDGKHDDYVDSMSQFFRQLEVGFPYWVPLKAYKPNTPTVNFSVYGV